MKHVRRLVLLLLCVLLVSSAVPAALAAPAPDSRHPEAVEDMVFCGFLQGSPAEGLQLQKSLTRAEAAVLLLRVVGGENEADGSAKQAPFTDVPDWAAPAVSYLWAMGMVNGQTAVLYGSDDTVTAPQFYAMLLRALGYSEKAGDFAYADTLAFAADIRLIPAEELTYLQSAASLFTRDDACFAAYRALRHPGKGQTEAYCLRVAKRLNASYTPTQASVIAGENAVYNQLKATMKAMAALESYTLTQKGTYSVAAADKSYVKKDALDTVVYAEAAENRVLYDIRIDEREDDVRERRHIVAYCADNYFTRWEEGEGWQGMLELPADLARGYIRIYDTLFAPDIIYCTNFDYTKDGNVIRLKGYNFRYELIGDITSSMQTDYYYDMEILIDAATNRIQRAIVTYTDTWQQDGKNLQVEYRVDLTFGDWNATQIPWETAGLSDHLAAMAE